MSAAGNWLEENGLNFFFTAGSVTRPTAWYVALYLTDPGDDGSGTEVSGTNYARTTVTFASATSSGVLFQTTNSGSVSFPTAGSDWGTVTHVAVYNAASGGDLLAHSALDSSKVVSNGDTFVINASNLNITLS